MNQGKITGSDRLSQGKEWLTAYLLNAIYLLTPYLPLFMLYLQLETAAPEATLLHQTPLIIQGFSKKPISIFTLGHSELRITLSLLLVLEYSFPISILRFNHHGLRWVCYKDI